MATARGSFVIRRSLSSGGPRFRFTVSGAWREVRRSEYRGWRELRDASGAHPNKPMHPTADTVAVICSNGLGRRVIGGVRRLSFLNSNS